MRNFSPFQFSTGEIGPFSSMKLEIIWQPTLPGRVDTEFVINFADPLSESVSTKSQKSPV